jgi:hypothetical protein
MDDRPRVESPALARKRHVDQVCRQFEAAWQDGPRPRLEDYLAQASELERPDLLRELVALDMDYRTRAGESPGVEEYRARFPDLDLGGPGASTCPGKDSTGPDPRPADTDAAGTPTTPAPATGPDTWPEVAGYAILGELGRGGMGVVYRARDLALKRQVALKMLVGEHASPEELARFRDEAEAVARLRHPHIVQVFATGEHHGQPYLVLEYLEGGPLGRRLQGRPQPPGDAARLVLLLARAVHAAHGQGVIHRDLKPSNVLLAPPADEPALNTPYGWPKVADFGLAKFVGEALAPERTQTGQVLGTPRYMAPEQAQGAVKDIGPATDVYALGVLLYEALTGRPPFRGATALETLHQVAAQEPEPPSRLQPGVPPALENICLKCLQKAPADRYPTAAALADDLRRFLGHEPVEASTVSFRGRAGRPFAGRRLRIAAAVLGACLLVGLVWLGDRLLRNGTPGATPGPAAQPAALKGSLDILIYDPADKRRQNLFLDDPGAMPLRPGDEFCIEAELNRPAYLYVLWIDTDGQVLPVYPWRPGHWEDRPAAERPVARLRRPEALDEFYKVSKGTPGMETLVLLARETPLPPDVDLRAELGPLPRPAVQELRATAWFENGEPVRNRRGREGHFDVTRREDPVLLTQQRIREKMNDHFSYVLAVSFANQGK